jgi:methylenetetrahydrofolate--tRNA-(uracil-5-)-methyltransferase
VAELVAAEKTPLHEFETPQYFEGCLPIEVMAERGPLTLAFGPMKPVGLEDPRGGPAPFAVVQLRQEDKTGTLYNLVGFQTKMKTGEQKRILRGLPGMRNAVFARFGSVHRNTFIRRLAARRRLQHRGVRLHFAGQMARRGLRGIGGAGLLWDLRRCEGARGEAPPPTRRSVRCCPTRGADAGTSR